MNAINICVISGMPRHADADVKNAEQQEPSDERSDNSDDDVGVLISR